MKLLAVRVLRVTSGLPTTSHLPPRVPHTGEQGTRGVLFTSHRSSERVTSQGVSDASCYRRIPHIYCFSSLARRKRWSKHPAQWSRQREGRNGLAPSGVT